MNKTLVAALYVAVMITLAGCKKKDNTPANTASVAFVNGCAGTSGIDAKVNSVNVPGAANIGFLGNSGYKPVTAGTAVTMAYLLTNVGTPVSSQSETLTMGTYYSAFSGGLLTAPTFLLVSDDLTAPTSSNAKIRLVDLSSDAISVNANAGTNITFATAITSLQASVFYTVPAGNYEIKVGDPSNIGTAVSTGAQNLSAGKIYTVILTGSLAGTNQSALKVTLLSNN